MSSPSQDRAKPAIGYIVAIGGGLFFAIGWRDGVWVPALGGVTLFLVSSLYIALCYGLRALASNDAGVRSQLVAITEAEARLAAYRAELAAEVESWRHTQQTEIQEALLAQQRLAGLAQLLDDTRQALAQVRAEKADLQQQLDDLAEEHNLLVQEALQLGVDNLALRRSGKSATADREHAPIVAPVELTRARSREQ